MGIISQIKSRLVAKEARVVARGMLDSALQTVKAQLGYTNQGSGGVMYSQRRGTAGEKWFGGLNNSRIALLFDHAGLRSNARRAYFESSQAKAIVDRMAESVAGNGLRLEASPNANILGITPDQAQEWAANVEARFDLWARSKGQHRSEKMTWYQSHLLYGRQQQRDNDQFIRLYYSGDPGLISNLQWEVIDPDQIRGDSYTSTNGPAASADGIERDSRGREKRYAIWYLDKDNLYQMADIPAVGAVSGRPLMLHGFAQEYSGQGRGYSRISHAIQEFSNLTDFSVAHIKKALNQAMLAVQNTNKQFNPSNPFEQILSAPGGAGPQIFDSLPPVPDGSPVVEDPRLSLLSVPEAAFSTPNSLAVVGMRQGDELKTVDQTAPVGGYAQFVDAFSGYLAAATGIPLEVVLMKFSNNYSASRASLILFWRNAELWRSEMASDYLDPVYGAWLAEEIAAGRVTAPGWSDPVMKAAWLNCNWIGTPMPNIDPARTMTADRGYVEMGATTLDRISRNLNGSSGSANRSRIVKEFSEIPVSPWATKQIAGGK